jgi:hypothetical protein
MTMIGVGLMLSVSRFARTTPSANRLNRPPADPPNPIDKRPRAGGALPMVGSRVHA